MDPLSIQMAIGSPPMLRGKISLPSLRGRKRSSLTSDTSQSPRTPQRLPNIDEHPHTTPTRSGTVRMRRGFRPLSVLTNSVLMSFGSDTLKAMEKIDGNKDVIAESPTESTADKVTKDTHRALNISDQKSTNPLAALPFSNESEISLRAFLDQAPPPADKPAAITGPFSDLYQLPPPDLSQHPAFSPNPFLSNSDAPSLHTTSTASEIKEFASQSRSSSSRFTDRTSGSSDAFGSAERRRFIFFEKLQSPTSTPKRPIINSSELSPLTKRHTKPSPIEATYVDVDNASFEAEKKRPSGGLRKISDMFKSKAGSETSSSPANSLTYPSPSTVLKEMESYLRKVTCSPTYQYTDSSWLPRHPHTGRFWRSRNLKCTNCVNVLCACCGRTCCAYKAAVLALETHKSNPQGRERALERIQQITMVFPYGREAPTFLQCTAGTGNGAGCGKLVCPDCCGVCPDEACADIQCRRCKKNPWAECEWHINLVQTSRLGDTVSIRHTV